MRNSVFFMINRMIFLNTAIKNLSLELSKANKKLMQDTDNSDNDLSSFERLKLIDHSMGLYMRDHTLSNTKINKLLRDTKFSDVDYDLEQLEKYISNNSQYNFIDMMYLNQNSQNQEESSSTRQDKIRAKAMSFNAFQRDLKSKGKQLQYESAKFVANKLIKPEILKYDKITGTEKPDPLEVEISDLKLFNEDLEDKLKSKESEIGSLMYTIKRYTNEKEILKLQIMDLEENNTKHQAQIDELEASMKQKVRSINEFTRQIIKLK